MIWYFIKYLAAQFYVMRGILLCAVLVTVMVLIVKIISMA